MHPFELLGTFCLDRLDLSTKSRQGLREGERESEREEHLNVCELAAARLSSVLALFFSFFWGSFHSFPKYFIFQNVGSPCNCSPRSLSSPQTGERAS